MAHSDDMKAKEVLGERQGMRLRGTCVHTCE
jgi:hypothetical protein